MVNTLASHIRRRRFKSQSRLAILTCFVFLLGRCLDSSNTLEGQSDNIRAKFGDVYKATCCQEDNLLSFCYKRHYMDLCLNLPAC
jgi:hypothetical protein